MIKKNKILIIFLLAAVGAGAFFVYLKLKHDQEKRLRIVLSQEMRKVTEYLMVDISRAGRLSVLDLPADGSWHHGLSFKSRGALVLEYLIQDGHLLKKTPYQTLLIADDIRDISIRREKSTFDILQVRIRGEKGVSLISNFKIRIRH